MAKFIAIEGIDGSGKNTQTDLLARRLRTLGYKVATFAFPHYKNSLFGHEVGAYLNGAFGSLDEVHPKLIAMLYAGDRFEFKDQIEQMIEDNDFLICDRYTASNVAHQSIKFSNKYQKQQFTEWLHRLEFDVYKLPHPDLTIFLNTPPLLSDKLVVLKASRDYTTKPKDLHEENREYLTQVYQEYLRLAHQMKDWQIIECVDEYTGNLKAPESIVSEIFDIVLLLSAPQP